MYLGPIYMSRRFKCKFEFRCRKHSFHKMIGVAPYLLFEIKETEYFSDHR